MNWFILRIGNKQTQSRYHNKRMPSFMMMSSNGNIFRVTGHLCGEFTGDRPVTRSFDAYFDPRPNKRLSKQSWGWWFETPSRPSWRHRNVTYIYASPGRNVLNDVYGINPIQCISTLDHTEA